VKRGLGPGYARNQKRDASRAADALEEKDRNADTASGRKFESRSGSSTG
jgi:hypothetical protein